MLKYTFTKIETIENSSLYETSYTSNNNVHNLHQLQDAISGAQERNCDCWSSTISGVTVIHEDNGQMVMHILVN